MENHAPRSASTPLPTIQVVGKGGVLRINLQDRDAWLKKGYKVFEPKAEPESPDLSGYTVPELKEFAEALEVEGFASMTKEPLVEALLAAGFVPPDEG